MRRKELLVVNYMRYLAVHYTDMYFVEWEVFNHISREMQTDNSRREMSLGQGTEKAKRNAVIHCSLAESLCGDLLP